MLTRRLPLSEMLIVVLVLSIPLAVACGSEGSDSDGANGNQQTTHTSGMSFQATEPINTGAIASPTTASPTITTPPTNPPDSTPAATSNPDPSPVDMTGDVIVGVIANSEISVIGVDGTRQRHLTDDPAPDGSPVWSPDGSTIAFSRWHNGQGGLFVMDADGTNLRQLTDFIGYGLRWSPDGQTIAVTGSILESGNQMRLPQIVIIAADGSGYQQLTSAESMPAPAVSAGNSWPDWSPDGNQLTFIGEQVDGLSQVYVIDRDGTNVRQITDSPSRTSSPSWSAEGSWIAFSTDFPDVDLWLVRPDGSDLQNLTASTAIEVGQVWSPTGQQLAFVRQDDAGIQIVAIDADGSNERVLYESPDHVLSLSWSPAGDQIVFARGNLGSTSDLYLLTVADRTIQQLTDAPTSELDPDWSPDGTRIVYTTDYGETYK